MILLIQFLFWAAPALAQDDACSKISAQTTPSKAFAKARELGAMPLICKGTLYVDGPLDFLGLRSIHIALAKELQRANQISIEEAYSRLMEDSLTFDYDARDTSARFHLVGVHRFLHRIVISSIGGLNRSAIWLASLASRHNLPVIIPDGETCQSACAYIFFASDFRHLGNNATLLLHRARLISDSNCTARAEACRTNLKRMGFAEWEFLFAQRLFANFLSKYELAQFDNFADLEFREWEAFGRGWTNFEREQIIFPPF